MFYPFRFKPILKEKIWGGNKLLTEFGKNTTPDQLIGESWEISGVPKNESVVQNGQLKGENLQDLIVEYKELILGKKVFEKNKHEFPLLIKFLDANNKLSVQVHPGDTYARKHHDSFGKTEIWFVLHADKGAKLIAGLSKQTNKTEMKKAIESGTLNDLLQYVPVKTGDVVFIPAGRVHALLEGTVIAEIQQSSDVTYRLYDWDRVDESGVGRELHIDHSLAVTNFKDTGDPRRAKKFESIAPHIKCAEVIRNDFFSIDQIVIKSEKAKYTNATDGDESFHIIIALDGEGTIVYDKGEEPIQKGESALLPAALGEYTIRGTLDFLRVFI